MIRQMTNDGFCIVKENGETVLRMEEKPKDASVVVTLTGSLDGNNAYDVYDELDALISVGKGIELEIGDVTHLSGTFESMLITLQQKMEETPFETLPIRNVPRAIYDDLKKKGIAYSLDLSVKEE